MKTAISLPDGDFERFERVAMSHGMNRSEFYRRAAEFYADELEGESELTALANEALDQAATPGADPSFLRESGRVMLEATEW